MEGNVSYTTALEMTAYVMLLLIEVRRVLVTMSADADPLDDFLVLSLHCRFYSQPLSSAKILAQYINYFE